MSHARTKNVAAVETAHTIASPSANRNYHYPTVQTKSAVENVTNTRCAWTQLVKLVLYNAKQIKSPDVESPIIVKPFGYSSFPNN